MRDSVPLLLFSPVSLYSIYTYIYTSDSHPHPPPSHSCFWLPRVGARKEASMRDCHPIYFTPITVRGGMQCYVSQEQLEID